MASGVISGPLSPVNPLTGKTVSVMSADCMLAGRGCSTNQPSMALLMCERTYIRIFDMLVCQETVSLQKSAEDAPKFFSASLLHL